MELDYLSIFTNMVFLLRVSDCLIFSIYRPLFPSGPPSSTSARLHPITFLISMSGVSPCSNAEYFDGTGRRPLIHAIHNVKSTTHSQSKRRQIAWTTLSSGQSLRRKIGSSFVASILLLLDGDGLPSRLLRIRGFVSTTAPPCCEGFILTTRGCLRRALVAL